MSRTIEIRGLTDAQCDALKAEAEAHGLKFFDHCRAKLLSGIAASASPAVLKAPAADPKMMRALERQLDRPLVRGLGAPEEDRIGRLEAMMVQMGETLAALAHPAVAVEGAPAAQVDQMNDLVADALVQIPAEEAAGQSSTFQFGQPFDRGYPDRSGDGVRHLGARRPLPLAGGTMPRHLAGLLPGQG